MSTSFVVKETDTQDFLIEKLAYLGLTPKESNDFIVYWVPQMENNPYNLIHFSHLEEYAQVAKLSAEPTPDTVLRIHMAWKSLKEPINIPPKQLPPTKREGFTLVEWGGNNITNSYIQ